jgi:hypothetical protein
MTAAILYSLICMGIGALALGLIQMRKPQLPPEPQPTQKAEVKTSPPEPKKLDILATPEFAALLNTINAQDKEIQTLRTQMNGMISTKVLTRVDNLEKALGRMLVDTEKARKAQATNADPNGIIEIPAP